MPPLSRRSFLLGTAGAALLAACGDDGGGGTSGPTTGSGGTPSTTTSTGTSPTSGGGTPLVLGEAFDRNGLLVAGIPQRAPFLLFEQTGGLVPLAAAPAALDFTYVAESGGAIETATVARAGDDVDRAYYPLVTTFPAPGAWTLTTEVGGQPLTSTVLVNDRADVRVPQVGDALPSVPTPTNGAPLDVDTICTRSPLCPFHAVSLDQALAAAQGVAVLVSTPAYCQVAICGPVQELLIAAAPAYPTIHIEVYPNEPPPDGLPSSLVTDAFGLAYEPVLFVAGRDGRITARLDNIYDGPELAAALATATA